VTKQHGNTAWTQDSVQQSAEVGLAEALPLEQSDDQAIMRQRLAQLNQCLLGPWEKVDGQILPRLTMAEEVAQLYERSTEYRDHCVRARLRHDDHPSRAASPARWGEELLRGAAHDGPPVDRAAG
jgi:hypothetical protein